MSVRRVLRSFHWRLFCKWFYLQLAALMIVLRCFIFTCHICLIIFCPLPDVLRSPRISVGKASCPQISSTHRFCSRTSKNSSQASSGGLLFGNCGCYLRFMHCSLSSHNFTVFLLQLLYRSSSSVSPHLWISVTIVQQYLCQTSCPQMLIFFGQLFWCSYMLQILYSSPVMRAQSFPHIHTKFSVSGCPQRINNETISLECAYLSS